MSLDLMIPRNKAHLLSEDCLNESKDVKYEGQSSKCRISGGTSEVPYQEFVLKGGRKPKAKAASKVRVKVYTFENR